MQLTVKVQEELRKHVVSTYNIDDPRLMEDWFALRTDAEGLYNILNNVHGDVNIKVTRE